MFVSAALLATTVGTALALPAAHPNAHLVRRNDVVFRNFIIDDSCQSAADLDTVRKAIEGMYLLAAAGASVSAKNYAYKTWIDPESNEIRHATTVKRFQTLMKVASPHEDFSRKVRMICDPAGKKIRECISGATAAVNPANRGENFESGTNGGEMFLCPKFLNPATSPPLRVALKKCIDDGSNKELANYRNSANALLHEMTHLRMFMNGGTADCMYGPATTRILATKAPWVSLINADSFSYMALAAYLLGHEQCSREMVATHDGSSGGLDNSEKPGFEKCRFDGSSLSSALKKEHAFPFMEDEDAKMKKQLEAMGLGESRNDEMNNGKHDDSEGMGQGNESNDWDRKEEAKKPFSKGERIPMSENTRIPQQKDIDFDNFDSPRPSNRLGPVENEKFDFENWTPSSKRH